MNLDRKLSIVLIVILIAAIVGTIYIIINPNPGEKFTEFYILGPDGKAGNYPTNLTAGQTGNVIIGIVNHEQSTTTYNLIIKLNNNTLKNENITILNNDKKEIPFSFIASGANMQKLEFLIYKLPDSDTIYRSLYLDINVK
ncbi:DUF1616 domain-containing protein [Methanobacterium sp. ACI-7]|uniref:DUF1616 domain-containing protein n=1 Tax=unclassified Methanobacterium TaxID=2627676 RepID=UPI0039C141D7